MSLGAAVNPNNIEEDNVVFNAPFDESCLNFLNMGYFDQEQNEALEKLFEFKDGALPEKIEVKQEEKLAEPAPELDLSALLFAQPEPTVWVSIRTSQVLPLPNPTANDDALSKESAKEPKEKKPKKVKIYTADGLGIEGLSAEIEAQKALISKYENEMDKIKANFVKVKEEQGRLSKQQKSALRRACNKEAARISRARTKIERCGFLLEIATLKAQVNELKSENVKLREANVKAAGSLQVQTEVEVAFSPQKSMLNQYGA